VADAISYTPAGKVVESFHSDSSFVRFLLGPVGSSKSSAACMELFTRACEQKASQGVRKSRWAVIRNTYPELKSTTIKTWADWFPMAEMRWDAPITSWLRLPLPDGTRMEMEVMFFPLDRPEEVGKLRSLELTGAWINEASEVAKAVFDMLTQRVGRFPKVSAGGATWSGVVLDSNFPDDDHWLYKIAEKNRPKDWQVFKQPGGLIFNGGDFNDRENYEVNPEAENIPNLPNGYEYYFRQLPGKSRDWIKVFVLAQYGTITDGKPIYPEWNDDLHCRRASPFEGVPLLLGFDYGLTPACVVTQVSPRGQLVVLAELFGKDMGIRQFARDVVKPFLSLNFHGYSIQAAGDPAGMARSDTDEKTCFMELAEEGIACVPATTNSFVGRREAVAKYLTRLVDGQPALLVDPGCDMIRRGFNGRYQYRRLQVVGEERYKDVPDKNDYSHLHDALQYAALHSQNMNLGSDWAKKIDYGKKNAFI
jgi:hypothetical protein